MTSSEKPPDSSKRMFGIPHTGAGRAVIRATSTGPSELLLQPYAERVKLDAVLDDIDRSQQIGLETGGRHSMGSRASRAYRALQHAPFERPEASFRLGLCFPEVILAPAGLTTRNDELGELAARHVCLTEEITQAID
jgi:hypothetical protein